MKPRWGRDRCGKRLKSPRIASPSPFCWQRQRRHLVFPWIPFSRRGPVLSESPQTQPKIETENVSANDCEKPRRSGTRPLTPSPENLWAARTAPARAGAAGTAGQERASRGERRDSGHTGATVSDRITRGRESGDEGEGRFFTRRRGGWGLRGQCGRDEAGDCSEVGTAYENRPDRQRRRLDAASVPQGQAGGCAG